MKINNILPPMLVEELKRFAIAYQFLTRIPAPAQPDYTDERLSQSARYYPLVGLLVGSLVALVYLALIQFFPAVPALVMCTAFSLYLTGAFHEDGFADMCDGVGGGHTATRALEIMKDSRLGTYGVAGLTLIILLKLSLLASLPTTYVCIALMVAHCLSRSSAVAVIVTSTYAREDGKAKPVSEGLSLNGTLIMLATSLVSILLLTLWTNIGTMLTVMVLILLSHLFIRWTFESKLGGYTGDCLGATQQVAEIAVYAGIVACL